MDQLAIRGELRLMEIKGFLARWGIELRSWRSIPAPAPDYRYVTQAEFFTRKWNAWQAQVFIKACCDDPDAGFPCEMQITGKHEFLRGGVSNLTSQLWV